MKLSASDERLLNRFLDGELAGDAEAACRARLEAEPVLREGLRELQQVKRAFGEVQRTSAMSGFVAPAGFTAGVLAAARRLPSRDQLREAEVGRDVITLCRRLLVAAVVLFCLGAAWHAGIFGEGRSSNLQAAPADVQREVEQLDTMIESPDWDASASRTGKGAAAPGSRRERHGK